MKGYLLSLAFVAFCCFPALSQQAYPIQAIPDTAFHIRTESRFSVNVHGGYALALGSTFAFYPDNISRIHVEEMNNTVTSKTTEYKAMSKGLGEGFRVGAGFSYIVNDFLNVGLDVDYFRSTIRKVKDSSNHNIKTTGAGSDRLYDLQNTISYDAILVTFTPNVTFKAISKPKWFIYNKIGAVFVIRPNSIQHNIDDVSVKTTKSGTVKDSSSHSDLRYEWGIRNPSFGFMGGVGIQVRVMENLRIFSELQFSHVVFQIRNRIVTDYQVNGKDMMATLPLSEKEVYYKNDYQTTGTVPNPNQPGQAATQRLPITYVGLQLGVVYRL